MLDQLSKGFKILYNQEDIQNSDGDWIKTYSLYKNGVKEAYRTRAYSVWNCMISRTNPNNSAVKRKPSLLGSINGFIDFNSFVEWCHEQAGYLEKSNNRYWELDKDILCIGNKIYCENFCAFVPQHINKMLILNPDRRGALPIGVHMHTQTGKFRAQLPNQEGTKHLGLFTDMHDAHAAWQKAKITKMELIINEYLKLKGSRKDVYNALMDRVSTIKEDLSMGKETKCWR